MHDSHLFYPRKQSTSSSLSSTSTLPDSPRLTSGGSRESQSPNIGSRRKTSSTARRKSNLADIHSDQESQESTRVSTGGQAVNNSDARRDRGGTGQGTQGKEKNITRVLSRGRKLSEVGKNVETVNTFEK